jgi:hypothetical protein
MLDERIFNLLLDKDISTRENLIEIENSLFPIEFKHDAEKISKACDVEIDLINKILKQVREANEDFSKSSQLVELLLNKFSKKELAFIIMTKEHEIAELREKLITLVKSQVKSSVI